MLETAEVGHAISKASYARQVPRLRQALLNAQFDLSEAKRGPVLILVSGVEGGGRSETANRLTEWMDPRHIRVIAFGPRTAEESARPPQWRYWRALPPRGKIGIFMNAWYNDVVEALAGGNADARRAEFYFHKIRSVERMLSDEGVRILKFWMHLPDAALRRRMKEVTRRERKLKTLFHHDLRRAQLYMRHRDWWEALLRETSTSEAPWVVVEGTDARYRELTVGKILLDTLHDVSQRVPVRHERHGAPPAPPSVDSVKLVRDLDLKQRVPDDQYDKRLPKLQLKIANLTLRKRFRARSLILAFEGVDAAGKEGAIRRVTQALDARQYAIVPIAAPNEEERLHPYLWRFWRHVPAHGGITIFDRTWYGRVLVERVEKLANEQDWNRAYGEINQFEEDLIDGGAVIVKFWLQISKAEQYRRFKAREKTSFKRFKITPDDWRNRKQWDAYEHAVADMVERTSTEIAPWTLVEAEDKRYARIKILRTICDRLEEALDR